MKNKKIIIIILVILVILALGVAAYFIFFNNSSTSDDSQNLVKVVDDVKVNTSSKLAEAKQLDELEITDLTLTSSNNISQLLGIITNKSEKVIEEGLINIEFVDKEGNKMTTIEAYIKELQPGESTQLNASTTFDYSEAYDIKVTK